MNNNPNHIRCSYSQQEISIPKHIQFNSTYNGFIQFGLFPSTPDLHIPTQGLGDYVSEWVRIYPRVHADYFSAPSAIGEIIVCHRSIYPNKPKVYTWFPIQAAPKARGAANEEIDYIIQKCMSYSPTTFTIHIGQWIFPNTQFRHYAPFIYASSIPLYVQDVISFQRAIWSGTLIFKQNPLRSIYPVVNNRVVPEIKQMTLPKEGASNVCGNILEGLFGKKTVSKIKSKTKSKTKLTTSTAATAATTATHISNKEKPEKPMSKESRQNEKIIQHVKTLNQGFRHLKDLVANNTNVLTSTKDELSTQINNAIDNIQQNNILLQTGKTETKTMAENIIKNNKILSTITDPNMAVVLNDGKIIKVSDLVKQNTADVQELIKPDSNSNRNSGEDPPVTEPFQEGITVFDCSPTGEDKEDIEMYNIPVGSAYAGVLSQNAIIRLGTMLGTFVMLMTVMFAIIPTIRNAIDPIKGADEFLAYVHTCYIFLFLFGTFLLSDNLTTKATLFYICFLFSVSFAFLHLNYIKDKKLRVFDFLKMIFKGDEFNIIISIISTILFVLTILLFILKAAGVMKVSGWSALKWSLFSTSFIGVLLLGRNGLNNFTGAASNTNP